MTEGLTAAEATLRHDRDGANVVAAGPERSAFGALLRRFASPLVAILVIASVISGVVGDVANAVIVLAIVVVSIGVEFVQTRRSEKAAAALRARVSQVASACRDGTWRDVPRAEIVVGDLIRLAAGDLVPADARLLAANDLHVNEAALTGESLPAEKHADPAAAGGELGAPHLVFLGSSVVSGTATATVTAIGRATAIGAIAHSLARRAPPTEFERGIARFGVFILEVVVFLVLFVFTVSAVLHHDTLESLMFAVALAVGVTPEFLPMITTVTLTRGAVRMARDKVIVKNLAAIQNFGSMDILCSDKTGTLTTGEMSLERHVDPDGVSAERPLLLASINSYFETGVDNPVDTAVLRKGRLDPLDAAVLHHDHPDISKYRKVDEIPFDFERRRVSVVAARDGAGLFVTKGAPESVIAACTQFERGGAIVALDAAARHAIEQVYQGLCRDGYRVLAVASRLVAETGPYTKADEHDLVLAGFLGFADPVRADAREVLAKMATDGIEVKVLTGDSELVAIHICAQVGIPTTDVILGSELATMSDPALAARAVKARIFARVSPAQKTRILLALKARGHVVGFLGDGINDAPSLHAADVGITVAGATDVAREAADIVLLEPGLRALSRGVLEGRRAFGNIMKYLLMGTSSNFGNMFSMAGAAIFLPFLPMLPKQILLNNFLYDLAQITIPTDRVDDAMVRKPRRWDIGLIRRFMLWIGPISSVYDFLTFYVMLRVVGGGEAMFHTGWFVESLATQSLVIFVIRTAGNPFRSRPSRALVATTLAIVGLACALPFTPLGTWLGFVPLPAVFFAFLAGVTATYLILVEIVKRLVLRRELA